MKMNESFKGKDFWDSTAVEYHSGRTKSRKYIVDPALFEVIGDVSGKRILDVACGAGDISIQLSQRGAICVGVDFSGELIKLGQKEAAKLGLNIDYRVMDARNIRSLDGKFDLAIVALLFPHLPALKDITQTVSGISRLLETDGRLVIAEPHPAFDFYMRKRLANGDFKYFSTGLPYEFQMDIGDHALTSEAYHWTLQDYSQALTEGGFVIRRVIEPQPIPESKAVDPEWYEEKSKYPSYIILDCVKQ